MFSSHRKQCKRKIQRGAKFFRGWNSKFCLRSLCALSPTTRVQNFRPIGWTSSEQNTFGWGVPLFRMAPGKKSKNGVVNIYSYTLGVIGVVRMRRRKRFRRPGMRCDRQQIERVETGSGNRSVIAAIDSSITCSYSTLIACRGLSATISTLENYFRFWKTERSIIPRRRTL